MPSLLRHLSCLCLVLLVLHGGRATAQSTAAPAVIPFQGTLANQAVNPITQKVEPVPDGTYSVIFNLYTQAVGAQPVWSERHARLGVTQGRINVFLGSQPGNPVALASLDFSKAKYLGITIDTDDRATTADPEMVPRQVIVPPWYALKTPAAELMQGYGWNAFLTGPDPATAVIQGNRFTAGTVSVDKLEAGAISANLAAEGVDSFLSSSSTPPAGYVSAGSVTLIPGGPPFYVFKKQP